MPLSPQLYSRLEALFGRVHIANRDLEGISELVRKPGGAVELKISDWGETYSVCCPFCGDRRQRLGINWRYGQPDPATDGRYLINYYCRCHNEGCVPGIVANRRALADRIFGFQNRGGRDSTPWTVLRGRQSSPATLTAPPPGDLIPLADLPLDHPAVDYLMGRRFGVDVMQQFGLSYCGQAAPQFPLAQDRIICPVDFDGRLAGPLCWYTRQS